MSNNIGTLDQFIDDIIASDSVHYKEEIRKYINNCIKKIEMRIEQPKHTIFYLVGEINGFFYSLNMMAITKTLIIMNVSNGSILFIDSKSSNSNIIYHHHIDQIST